MKSISTVNPAIMENTECTIVEVCAPIIDKKSGLSTALAGCIIMLRFASSSSNIWLTFQAKSNVRTAPACTALTYVSHQSHNMRTANCHLRSKGERNGVQRRTKVSFGRTIMQALELLQLAKRHDSG